VADPVKFKVNIAGVRKILRSERVLADLTRRAENVARAAGGDGYLVDAGVGRERARAAVVAGRRRMRDEARTRQLTAALRSAAR
jgi:hypothetical protein